MSPRHPPTRSAEHGFSLVELVVTVVVLGILAAIAVPRFADLIACNKLNSAANEMVALLQTARGAAISGRASATVCPTTTGTTCAAGAGSRWIALISKNGTSTVLRESNFNSAVTVKPSNSLSTASNKFTFIPSGFSSVGSATSGAIAFCSSRLSTGNDIDVRASVGRITTSRRNATTACTAPSDN